MMSQLELKSKRKVALLRPKDDSDWVSCRSITANLESAYTQISDARPYFLYSEIPSYTLIEEFIRDQVDTICFLDHRVRLGEILTTQRMIDYIKKNRVKIIIHTYGCFVDRMVEYYQAAEALAGQDLVFVGSSPRQVTQMQKVISPSNVELIPFPVDGKTFAFNLEQRKLLRHQLGVSEDTTLFLYAGRISCLKNVELVMHLLAEKKREGKNIAFHYVGHFDSHEPLSGQSYLGQMEILNSRVQRSLDPKNEWCFHQSFISPTEMPAYYSAADAFISFSTYRGEDFGMAIAEAKSSGLPSFLTDWGGYSGFRLLPITHYAKVTLTNSDILIELSELSRKLTNFIPASIDERLATGQATNEVFGVDAVAKRLLSLIERAPTSGARFNYKTVFWRETFGTGGSHIMTEMRSLYEPYYS